MNFPPITLVDLKGKTDPQAVQDEINKALNDLAAKINSSLQGLLTTSALNSAISGLSSKFAPLPQSGAGAGQWKMIQSTLSGALSLPAGGTWAYWSWQMLNSTAGLFGINGANVTIAAGGTQIMAANTGYIQQAGCWEILDARGFDESKPIYKRDDGSFVITAETGHPYHVLTHEQALAQGTHHDALYDELIDWIHFMQPEIYCET